MDVLTHVGSRIRLYRKHKGLTIQQLSELLHVGTSTISKYENGKIAIDISTLFEIAKVLDINVNQLTDYHGDRKPRSVSLKGNNFFKRSNLYFLYQYWGREKAIYLSAIEIIHDPNSENSDKAIMYYDCVDEENYTNCAYLYDGTIDYSDSFTHMFFQNIYVSIDKVLFIAKNTFKMDNYTFAMMCAISQSVRNPYAVKTIMSTEKLSRNDKLINDLLITEKDTIAELKRSNALFVF